MPRGDESLEIIEESRWWLLRSKRIRLGLAISLIALIIVVIAWSQRSSIADDIIKSRMDELGLESSYEIVSIGPRTQIVRNVEIGKPGNPDLAIEELIVSLDYGFGAPTIGSLRVKKPRLYASYDDESGVSFGQLDQVLFAESDGEGGLSDFDLDILDGELSVATPAGSGVGNFEGSGNLSDGFVGNLS